MTHLWPLGYGVTANITASHAIAVRGSSGFDSPYPNAFFIIIYETCLPFELT